MGHIDQIGTGCLGEHRWRLAGHAEVDAADVEAFQQLGAAGEFGPLHLDAVPGQPLLQGATGLESDEGAVLLVTDTDRLLRLRQASGQGQQGNGEQRTLEGELHG